MHGLCELVEGRDDGINISIDLFENVREVCCARCIYSAGEFLSFRGEHEVARAAILWVLTSGQFTILLQLFAQPRYVRAVDV